MGLRVQNELLQLHCSRGAAASTGGFCAQCPSWQLLARVSQQLKPWLQGSSAPMQPHLAPGTAAGISKAGRKTTPQSLFLTCQAGFRCMWGRRVREWLPSPGSSMTSISPQCFQRRFNILRIVSLCYTLTCGICDFPVWTKLQEVWSVWFVTNISQRRRR